MKGSSRLVLGGPGAGKTTRLLEVVEKGLARGLRPEEIAFVAFSKMAATEARERASQRFGIADPKALRHFRTIHSTCFHALGLRRSEVLGWDHLQEVADLTGEPITSVIESGPVLIGTKGDEMVFLDQYRRTRGMSLEEAWREHGNDLGWYRLDRFTKAYTQFKHDTGLMDFTDMLERYVDQGSPIPVKLAIVDEAQDLTRLQWAVIRRAFSNAEEFWVGGDDDQAVHRWAGAAVDELLNLGYEREVLPVSHRLPKSVFALASSVVARISRRYPKEWTSTPREGTVEWISSPWELDLSSGSWLLLGRTRTLLGTLEAVARSQGVHFSVKGIPAVVPAHIKAIQVYNALREGKTVTAEQASLVLRYTPEGGREVKIAGDAKMFGINVDLIWHDALTGIPLDDREYYVACLRRGEKLTQAPRVRIDTMHGSKGTEADNVLVMTDLTPRTHRGMELDPDSEHRVFYVGITRARENLYLTEPRGFYGYRL